MSTCWEEIFKVTKLADCFTFLYMNALVNHTNEEYDTNVSEVHNMDWSTNLEDDNDDDE